MQSFYIGKKTKPSFLVEILPKKKEVKIYKPDKYSKKESNFYERYALGELLIDIKYKSISLSENPIPYKECLFVPKIILKIKNNNYLVISNKIKITDFLPDF